MSEPPAFQWVEIEGFRGFRDRQRIDLSASAVVVVGPNGTGKTSFFDALQWLLVGSLQRLEKLRVRKNDEHIVNAYVGADPAVVEGELRVRGQTVHLRRQGRYDSGFLEWNSDGERLRGEEAERALETILRARAGQDVRRLLMTSALLQQDVVREVLEDKPAERYKHLAALLGLDDLAEFQSAVSRRAERLATLGQAARKELQTAEDRHEHLTSRHAKLVDDVPLEADVIAERDAIIQRLEQANHEVTLDKIPVSAAGAAVLEQTAAQAANQLDELGRTLAALNHERAAHLAAPGPENLATVQNERDALEEQLEEAQRAEAEANRAVAEAQAQASKLDAIAAQALELLGPTCPVCGQDIDPDKVSEHLHTRLDTETGADLAKLQEAAAEARTLVGTRRIALAERQATLDRLLAQRARADKHAENERLWRTACEDFSVPGDAGMELGNLADVRQGDAEAIEAAARSFRSVALIAAELVAVLRSDASDSVLSDLRAQMRRAEETLPALKAAARQASQQEETAKGLRRSTTRAVTAVTDRRFRRLAPTVQDIYWRLSPHPSFTSLDFDLDVYREQGIATPVVSDEMQPDIKADPSLVFSSSQANVTALSYFLALGWAAGKDGLPFVLLDDPLQSMDDVNALGFADLCRHVRRQRQLIVSTHDRRLASLLQRKLAPRIETETTRLIEFKAWTREGPEIDQDAIEPQLVEGGQRSVVQPEAA